MQVPHLSAIFESLGNPYNIRKLDPDFVEFTNFALGGHPRLFRAFISMLSHVGCSFLPITERPESLKEAVQTSKSSTEADKQKLGPPFYIKGYDAFFALKKDHDRPGYWKLVKDTWETVKLKQFPEVSLGILQADGISICSFVAFDLLQSRD
jgi:hypothetical protein